LNNNNWLDIKWYGSPNSPKAILQIPVSFEGIDQIQYLQLDTGCPESILFGYQFLKLISEDDSRINDDEIYLNGSIGDYKFTNFKFEHKKNFGKDRADQGQEKIGLLGTDFLKDKILIIDFINNRLQITSDVNVFDDMNYKFNFIPTKEHPKNVIILNASLNKHKIDDILYDTGSSGYILKLYRKEDWKRFVGETDLQKLEKHSIRNLMGKYNNYNCPIKGELQIGEFLYKNPIITFSDTDLYSNSPINALIGNKPFFNSCIVLDFRNCQFGISK